MIDSNCPAQGLLENADEILVAYSKIVDAALKVDFAAVNVYCSSHTFPSSNVCSLVDSVQGVSEISVLWRAIVDIVSLHTRTVLCVRRQSPGPSLRLLEITR